MTRYFTVVCRLGYDATPHTVIDAIEDIGHGVVLAAMGHGHVIDESTRYREALEKLLPKQDPLDAECVCGYCGATVPWDEAQGKHTDNCPWLMTYGTKEPTK